MNRNHISWALVIIGVVIGLCALPGAKAALDYVNNSKYATGTVFKNAEEDYHNSHFYIPMVQFTTADGQTQEFKSTHEYSPQKYSVGDQVEVIYDPANPSKADLNVPIDIWSGPGTYVVLGLMFILIGIFGKDKTRNTKVTNTFS